MDKERIFLDTAFILALLNRRDGYHHKAKILMNRVRKASELWLTEAIIVEVGNALSSVDRKAAADFITSCYDTPKFKVVSVTATLMKKGIDLYRNRIDKEWGLTDCISFVVMKKEGLSLAVTADKHFRQAGFIPLMLE